jgi:hypothetical protein
MFDDASEPQTLADCLPSRSSGGRRIALERRNQNLQEMKKLLLILLLGSFAYADQVNCIKWKDANGSVIRTYCRPFTVIAGNGIALSDNNAGAITISTDGSPVAAGAGGSDTQVQFNSTGSLAGDSTVTFNSTTKQLSAQNIGAIRYAAQFAGADLGAKINAADADLGATAGEIWVAGGGAIGTQVILSSNHTLRLFPGTYTNSFGEYVPPFLLKDNSSLICSSKETVIKNSSNAANHENVVVSAYNATISASTSTEGLVPNNARQKSAGIKVEGCHFADSGLSTNTSLTATVALVNCHNCKAINNWFDEIASSHITLVGNSGTNGYFGDSDIVSGNLSSGAVDAAFSIIDNSNVDMHDNTFRHHGNGAAAFIDLESNVSTDLMEFLDIHDNVMDMSDAVNSVYGVTLQSAGTLVRHIKIHDNIMHGLPPGGTNKFVSGVTVGVNGYAANSMSDVEVYNNQISFTSSDAIGTGGVTRAWVHDNKILCAGGKAIAVFGNTLDSIIERNTVSAPLSYCDGASTNYRVLQFTTIAEVAATADRNIFRDNIAGRVIALGASSKIINTTPVLGTGVTYRVPVGFTSFSGGLATAQLAAPTLSVTTGAVGSCVISGPTVYYWRVTAVDANGGETTASNEVTQTAGGANGCPNLSWTFVPGAASFNVYRFTASNGELLIANVTGGDLFYADLGGQTPGAAYPTVNTTGRGAFFGLNNSGYEDVTEIAAPSNPSAGINRLYADSTAHTLKCLTSSGASCFVAATATALAADPADCGANTFASAINASGTLGCTSVPVAALAATSGSGSVALTTNAVFTTPNIGAATGSVSGNAGTATALAANGGNCTGNNFALGVDASGVGECAQPAFSNLSGTATDAQVPDNITISLAATATALAADPANCAAGSVAAGITAGGVAEGCAVFAVTKAAVANQFLTSYTSGTGAFTSAQPAFTDISGAATDAQVPDNITVTLAATATALAANPADCSSGQFANAINASGTLTCTTAWVVSGTSTFTTTAVASGACQTTVTTAATGTATTDTIDWAYSSAPTAATDGRLIIQPYVTANNVNFMRCNPTAASITPTALTVNWRVIH